jgi:hypothetical protein
MADQSPICFPGKNPGDERISVRPGYELRLARAIQSDRQSRNIRKKSDETAKEARIRNKLRKANWR